MSPPTSHQPSCFKLPPLPNTQTVPQTLHRIQFLVAALIVVPWSLVLLLSWAVNRWQLPWRPLGGAVWYAVDRLDRRAPRAVEWLLWAQGALSLALHVVTVGVNLGVIWVRVRVDDRANPRQRAPLRRASPNPSLIRPTACPLARPQTHAHTRTRQRPLTSIQIRSCGPTARAPSRPRSSRSTASRTTRWCVMTMNDDE